LEILDLWWTMKDLLLLLAEGKTIIGERRGK